MQCLNLVACNWLFPYCYQAFRLFCGIQCLQAFWNCQLCGLLLYRLTRQSDPNTWRDGKWLALCVPSLLTGWSRVQVKFSLAAGDYVYHCWNHWPFPSGLLTLFIKMVSLGAWLGPGKLNWSSLPTPQDNPVSIQQLQLVGITAMFIASKYEDRYIPAIADFAFVTDRAYTTAQIRDMEMKILRVLKFSFGRPLPLQFLRRASKIGEVSCTRTELWSSLVMPQK